MENKINFSYNWNKKLYTHYFTTIRLKSDKFKIGNPYKIFLTEKFCYEGLCIDIRNCKIDELPEYTCYLDTGYSKHETIKMLKTMYSKHDIDWTTQQLSVILIQNLEWEKPKD